MRKRGTVVGLLTLFTVFVIVCTVMFTVFSILSVYREETLVNSLIDRTEKLYSAEAEVKGILNKIENNEIVDVDIVEEIDGNSFIYPFSEKQGMYVHYTIENGSIVLKEYSLKYIKDWQVEDKVKLMEFSANN